MSRSPALLLGVAGASVALDQWSKHWANARLAFHEPIHLIDDLLTLTYTRNSGIAFGMFAGKSFPFYIFSVVAAVAVFWLWSRHPKLPLARQWSLALILGGAIGNLIDRVRNGEVVDFILLSWGGHEFPVFNVADMCVTCGVILFALVWTHEPRDTTEPALAAEPALAPVTGESLGQDAGAGSAGHGGGSPIGPVAGDGPEHGPLP